MKKYLFVLLSCITLTSCAIFSERWPDIQMLPVDISTNTAPLATPSLTVNRVEVTRLDLTKANVTYLTSEVNSESVNKVITDIQHFNEKSKGPIYLILDTPGGNVMDGARLISVMETSKLPVYAIDTGLAASMGFMILEYAAKRYAVPRAILMAHPASIGMGFQGELDKAVSRLAFMKRFVDKMDYFVATRAGLSYEDFKLKSNRELCLDSNDALDQHLLDGVVSVKLPVQSMFGLGSSKLNKDITLE